MPDATPPEAPLSAKGFADLTGADLTGATLSGAKFFSKISGAFGGPTLPTPSKMPGFESFFRSNTPQSSAAGARMFEMTGRTTAPASSVTINVNGGDPAAVVDALRRYSRQNGGISGVRLS